METVRIQDSQFKVNYEIKKIGLRPNMKIKLKDIIDLDYLITRDEALDSREEIQSRAIRDRRIYQNCKKNHHTERALLISWLKFRREEIFNGADKKEMGLLPGSIFSSLYTWMIYIIVFSGFFTGISLAYSFLAYHGGRPINVTVFLSLFVGLPVVLSLVTLILLVQRIAGMRSSGKRPSGSIIHSLLFFVFFDLLPEIMKKKQAVFRKSLNTLEYTSSLIRMKSREYKNLFFWPFFILTSAFGLSISAGVLCGTFFRVVVSDMAFGWQSTLVATSTRVHDLISFIALPWSWFVPENLAHPSLVQIEGSRIILKDGISVLATQNLISWWPFICLAILFYAVIPRGFFLILGLMAQQQTLKNFNINRPGFRQLIVRMQSPVLDIDASQIQREKAAKKNPDTLRDGKTRAMPENKADPDIIRHTAVILVSKNVYPDKAIHTLIHGIEDNLFFDVREHLNITFDIKVDKEMLRKADINAADQVILFHEVWQPPIRGVLYYIANIKATLPETIPLWIVLTREPSQENLSVEGNDMNLKIWKKTIVQLKNPDIAVKRFVQS